MSLSVPELPALHTTGTFPELAIHNHGLRMDAVIAALSCAGIRRVIDIGCGDGALAKKISNSGLLLDAYIGIDTWQDRLDSARTDASTLDMSVEFMEGSMTDLERVIVNPELFRAFGAVVLLETIEHIPRGEVPQMEVGVFDYISPQIVAVTTPDATKRLNEEQLQARGHHFEWDIPEFHNWAVNVTDRYPDYSVNIHQLTGPTFIRNTQIAVFSRAV